MAASSSAAVGEHADQREHDLALRHGLGHGAVERARAGDRDAGSMRATRRAPVATRLIGSRGSVDDDGDLARVERSRHVGERAVRDVQPAIDDVGDSRRRSATAGPAP
jgi:hypothetical protein